MLITWALSLASPQTHTHNNAPQLSTHLSACGGRVVNLLLSASSGEDCWACDLPTRSPRTAPRSHRNGRCDAARARHALHEARLRDRVEDDTQHLEAKPGSYSVGSTRRRIWASSVERCSPAWRTCSGRGDQVSIQRPPRERRRPPGRSCRLPRPRRRRRRDAVLRQGDLERHEQGHEAVRRCNRAEPDRPLGRLADLHRRRDDARVSTARRGGCASTASYAARSS